MKHDTDTINWHKETMHRQTFLVKLCFLYFEFITL